MLLADRCQRDFDASVRNKGQIYFRGRSVTLVEQSPTRVRAKVRGSAKAPYAVSIDWKVSPGEPLLRVGCTCPYFAGGELCKHVWATLLDLDHKRISARIPGSSTLTVEMDEEFLDQDYNDVADEWSDDPDEFLDDVPRRPDRLPLSTRTGVVKSARIDRNQDLRRAAWRSQLQAVQERLITTAPRVPRRLAPAVDTREVWYVLNLAAMRTWGDPVIEFYVRTLKRNGEPSTLKKAAFTTDEARQLPNTEDRALVQLLLGTDSAALTSASYYGYGNSGSYAPKRLQGSLVPAMYELLLPRLCATGRVLCAENTTISPLTQGAPPMTWDDGAPWRVRFQVSTDAAAKEWHIVGELYRDELGFPLTAPALMSRAGLAVFRDRWLRFDAEGVFDWVAMLRQVGEIVVPFADRAAFLAQFWSLPQLPPLNLPADWQWEQVRLKPRGKLVIKRDPKATYYRRFLWANASFLYDDREVPLSSKSAAIVDAEKECVVLRDADQERQLVADLHATKLRQVAYYIAERGVDFELDERHLTKVVDDLVAKGWTVEAEGKLIRRPGAVKLSVKSNVDWFELDGEVDFDGVTATLPQLLTALRNREKYVRLDDGSQGVVPQEWLAKFGQFAALGDKADGTLKFLPAQAMLLDALLAAQDNVDVDRQFDKFRDKLRSFSGVEARQAPAGFQGTLRHYQEEGLGWLHFLQEFRFGGCLADDMGLGKTVQVLALLEERRVRRTKGDEVNAPSLVVVPRSLVFNWIEEASRFAPKLRVLSFHGKDRGELAGKLAAVDLVVTTYGTLLRDIVQLKDIRFDYAILDESQAIKNAHSQSAKACRLINAEHRLAMTGTPVENHLGELWSLFEFLNPGILGRSATFQSLARTTTAPARVTIGPADAAPPSAEALAAEASSASSNGDARPLLAHALRPFILRRTKKQVLTELPERTEQTLYCEMEPKQRKLYDELRDYYRTSLADRVAKSGLAKSKIHVLEALLRLRQAACHPGLLDKKKVADSSAKLDALLEQLDQLLTENHKALVFSQFTSLLDIVRQHLDKRQITYEYLDGRTQDRQARVHRFQEDPNCPLFLISLKAGGHGLNLTAADYVFILDPWWNPAVEAQAVDRAYRIGQTRHVFAYRLICRDTVEEKIMALQKSKRDLADAIITADNSLIRTLTADDLQLLLS